MTILKLIKKNSINLTNQLDLPQMNGYIKYLENGDKSMSFVVRDDDVLDKNNKIWDKIKTDLNDTYGGT